MVDYQSRKNIKKKRSVHDSLTDSSLSFIPQALLIVAAVGYGCKKVYEAYQRRQEKRNIDQKPPNDLEKKF